MGSRRTSKGIAGAAFLTGAGAVPNVLPPAAAAPAVAQTPAAAHPARNRGLAVGWRPTRVEPNVVTLLKESFVNDATSPNLWESGDSACLTAGTSETPPTSVPACGANAPQDPNGSGALQLTPPSQHEDGYVFVNRALPLAHGLSVTFNFYSFDGIDTNPGDGLALVFAHDWPPGPPSKPGGCCGSLDYAPYVNNGLNERGLHHGYLAVALDESGVFSQYNEGRTGGIDGVGGITNLIGARGATPTRDQYLLSTVNAQGKPASLPFPLGYPSTMTRPTALTVTVKLTSSGLLSVSTDQNTGLGPVVYIPPTNIVGLVGQPALPLRTYIGFTAAAGDIQSRHQINDLVVTTGAK